LRKMGQKQPQKLGDSSDVTNVNPMTGEAMDANQQSLDQLDQLLYGGGGEGGAIRGFQESRDPTAGFNWFLGNAPQFQEVAMGATQPLVQNQMEMANMVAPTAVQDVAAQYGGPANSYYSGGAANAMLDQAAQVRQGALGQALQTQTGMAQQLMGSALNQAPQAFGQARQQDLGLIGQAFGAQQGALGNITGLGAPEWWQPTYQQQATPWGNFLQNTSDIMGIGANAAMMASGFGG
jgi:hypothetical protein